MISIRSRALFARIFIRSIASDDTFVDDVSEPGVSGRFGAFCCCCCTSFSLGGSGSDLFGENIRFIVETRSRSDGLGGASGFLLGNYER